MRKIIFIIVCLSTLFIAESCNSKTEFSKKVPQEEMKWWKDATFGMFIHWGVYADLAGTWKGEAYPGYAEHLFRMAEIPLETYKKEVAANFNPVKFDAEEWVKICKDAGMKYMVITSKHHDGFAMFDTKVPGWEDYDIVDGTKWGRDPMKELKAACDKHGVKFGFYYSHSQDWSHRFGQRNTWDYNQPTVRGVWFDDPEWKEHRDSSIVYVKEKAIPQLREIIENYDPAIIWFDTRNWLPDTLNQIILEEARRLSPNCIFSSRSALGYGDYQTTADKPVEFPPVEGYWEAIPTTNESYGYHASDTSHKPSSYFIKQLSKTAARGGNLLMNVGPMGTGEIAPIDVEILGGIGNWLEINGEAIYGVERTTLPVNAWGESSIKGNKLYLHVFQWPTDQKLIVGGLKSTVTKAYLLADPNKESLKFERINENDVVVEIPQKPVDSVVSMIVLEIEGEIATDDARLLVTNVQTNRLHAFDGNLTGKNVMYGSGKASQNCIFRWNKSDSFISWRLRSNSESIYKVQMVYDAPEDSENNKYVVKINEQEITGDVNPGQSYEPVDLGQVTIKEGITNISVVPLEIESSEFMLLRSIILTPVK